MRGTGVTREPPPHQTSHSWCVHDSKRTCKTPVGRGSSRLSLRFIDKDPDVLPGDLVATSPASTLLPPNVPVGVIQSVDEQAVPGPTAMVQLIAAPEAIDWVQVQTR